MKKFNHQYYLDFTLDSDNENPSEEEVYKALKERFEGVNPAEVLIEVENYNSEEND